MAKADTPNDKAKVEMPACRVPKILAGQKAIVTGGNSGIGKACVLALADAGADVLINYYSNPDAADELVEQLRRDGRQAAAQKADVSNEEDVAALFDHARDEFGTVDILVNNAGLQQDAPLEEMTIEQWRRVIDVNLTGQFLCAREAVKEFRRRGVIKEVSCAAGKIICISSVHDVIPWAGHVNYAASKGGVSMLMKSIAQEVAEHRIRVNAVAPGAIKTNINRQAWESDDARDELLSKIPYNRIGETDDIGRVVAWLASDQADYITGTTIVVDGGMTLYPGFREGG